MMEVHQPKPEHLAVLESNFGHTGFRPMQWTIIRSIVEDRRDNCVIMATGYGKSLTYQYPSVYLNKLTMVISPLISLMEDQVLSLNLSNIPACLLGSAQRANPLPDILAGKFRVVYLTPEYVTGDSGRNLLQNVVNQLALIAIDEAHCLSKWGHDFRPAYRGLGIVRKVCPQVPILAVTATATPHVREDIVSSLGLRNPQVLCTGFDRANLTFQVRMKGSLGVWEDVKGLLSRNTEGSIIIYCLTRKQTEEIVELLQSRKIDCEPYHAGLSLNQRREVHERFVRDKIQIIVATIAFGMGIDKPDVRLVIHYGCSKDLESYYQEAGRAGRDGQPSRCIMFWSRADFKTHEFIREHSSGGVQKNLESLSKKMHEYLDTRDCRRLFILKYFDGDNVKIKPRKNCCDNCDRLESGVKDSERYEGIDDEGRYDFTKDTEHLLKAIEAFGGGTGLALPIALLRGSKAKKLHESYLKNPLHGVGKSRDEEWWKALAGLLEREQFLLKAKIPNNFNKFAIIYKIQLTPLAKQWLQKTDRKLLMKPTNEMFKSIRLIRVQPLYDTSSSDFQSQPPTRTGSGFDLLPVPSVSGSTSNGTSSSKLLDPIVTSKPDLVQDLVKTLLKKRSELATAYECMPYMIASNQALHQMATIRPLNLDEMKKAKLDGFSDIKIQKFGKEFLMCIQQKLNFLPNAAIGNGINNNNNEAGGKLPLQAALLRHPLAKTKFSPTQHTSWNLWNEERSIADIAKFRSLSESSVITHLTEAIKHGFPFGWSDFARLNIDQKLFQHIKANLPENASLLEGGFKLTDIKNRCLPHITFDQIKVVLTHVQVRIHLNNLNVSFVDHFQEFGGKADSQPEKTPPKENEDLWGEDDEDDVAVMESSFAEMDRMCEKANAGGSGEPKISSSQNDSSICIIDDDDEEFDLDEIAALEKAVINDSTNVVHRKDLSPNHRLHNSSESLTAVVEGDQKQRMNSSPVTQSTTQPRTKTTFKSRAILYEDEDEEQKQIAPCSPAKQPKLEEPEAVPKNIFRFKTASSSSSNISSSSSTMVVNKRIVYEDSDDDAEESGPVLPRRKF
ncbi:bifunctional 3'-5' exonuclease/ATP-dependent helicase WRN-like [Uranotaenia lowii]|uniref:bifunctional 3'-5' exonuclease/ATP-dependent helicase WRN-like n=1 Tax=Uranotaenia lowii TaxID=190385 RepID=UPI0024792AF8|nr:bifunctional 3'-5' exonuclease/ATP-dependent helicase WRN-like [Uranotaenia lowii]